MIKILVSLLFVTSATLGAECNYNLADSAADELLTRINGGLLITQSDIAKSINICQLTSDDAKTIPLNQLLIKLEEEVDSVQLVAACKELLEKKLSSNQQMALGLILETLYTKLKKQQELTHKISASNTQAHGKKIPPYNFDQMAPSAPYKSNNKDKLLELFRHADKNLALRNKH